MQRRHADIRSALLFTAILTPTLASAQVADADYRVEHNFNYMPAGDVVEVRGADFRHAWIRTTGIFGSAWSAEAVAQDPFFDPFGTDSMGTAPAATNSGLGMPVPCVYNTFNIPPSGINGFQCIVLPLGQSFATACTEFFVAPYSTTPPFSIQGTVASSGGVHAVLARAYAYSSAGISVRGGIQLANGTIQWNPIISDVVGAGATATGQHWKTDPVHFSATNLNTGVQIDASLFEFELNSSGDGTLNWDGGIMEIDQSDLLFTLNIPPQFIAPGQEGHIILEIAGGQVVFADDSGIFDGMLPPLGQTVPLVFPLLNDLTLDFDLGLDPAFGWDVLTNLSGGAGTLDESSCPADLNGDGQLDFVDISLFVKFFTSGDPLADLNGDKELDFVDVSIFVDSFASDCAGPVDP